MESVVLRYFEHGRAVGAVPTTLVEQRPDLVALYLHSGADMKWPHVGGRRVREVTLEERFTEPWEPGDGIWAGEGPLILGLPGRPFSVWLFWEMPTREFAGWYVNLEDPWRRSRLGFDTRDHTLDVWVTPDRRWSWKDEDELEVAERLGHYSPAEIASIRAAGTQAVQLVEAWAPPFSEGWELWAPDPDWPAPELPEDWDRDGVP
jgi:hypothetical protein